MSDDLSEATLERALENLRFGSPRRVFASIGSTNTEALNWAEEGAPQGALVLADHQTTGRGRRGRSWFDEPGSSVMLSIVLRPQMPPAAAGILTTALGVAIAEGIEAATALPVKLKWPNDVMVQGRKIAGILVETRMSGPTLDFAVAGVGVNVTWDMDEGADLPPGATSVKAEVARGSGRVPTRPELIASLVRAIQHICPLMEEEAGCKKLIRWASQRSAILGQEVTVRRANGDRITGLARCLSPTGGLLIESRGRQIEVVVGEVESLRSTRS